MTLIYMVEGDMLSRCEIFDEANLDSALGRFDELHPQAPRLENAATRVYEHLHASFAVRDWDAITEILADSYYQGDHRRVVGDGIRHGRDALFSDLRVAADLGIANAKSDPIATRGERLALTRARYSRSHEGPEAFYAEFLQIVAIETDDRISTLVAFDLDDIGSAFAELDARYLAGEAATHAQAWSAIMHRYAALNRHELPSDRINVDDHRRLGMVEPGDPAAVLRAGWDLTPNFGIHIEAVHRLGAVGAVVTRVTNATSEEGFAAQWRAIDLWTIEGDRVSGCELFDEADLDAALARFDELCRPTPRLENAASQVVERFQRSYAARDWDAMAETMAEDIFDDDRRHVVNAGVRRGRDAEIANLQAVADIGAEKISSTVIATRGERLVLCCVRPGNDERPEAFQFDDVLQVVEIDANERIAAVVTLDLDDIDSAFEELDARYLAGEATAHAPTWTLIERLYAGLNRHELPQTTPDFVDVDHRRLAPFAAGDIIEFARTAFDQIPDLSFRIEAVHRLSNLGAVVTQALRGTSREGFEAEWREIHLTMMEGDLFSRSEIFDEADLDAALARFDQLSRTAPRLENSASRVYERYRGYFAARDWAAMAELLTADTYVIDHRRVVNSGVRRGRDVEIANMQAVAEIGAEKITSTVIATRGVGLALCSTCIWAQNQQPGAFRIEFFSVVEINADERIMARVAFDQDGIDAAFAELDARYLAGEAAAHSQTWSVIARECAAFNRHELTAVDYITVDHRPLPIVEAYSQGALRVWDVTPDFGIHIEAVHRLSDFGAVATYQANGTSPEGFDGEWRMILLLTVEGDRINCCEVFEDSDVDAALVRFEEMQPQAPRLENAASQIIERYLAHFAARDWAAFAELLADDVVADDRRRVVNAGIRRGRDVHIADMRATVEVSAPTFSSSIIATRGERLALAHVRIFNRGMTGEVGAEALGIGEIDADERIVATVSFDPDDIDAAYEELDARYLAGEAAAHAHTWSVIARECAAFNRHELPATDWVTIDHRQLAPIDASDLQAAMRAVWDLTPDLSTHIEAVHRLSSFGAVVAYTAHGTSLEGFDAEWRMIEILTVERARINRCEVFDEADLDAALARFEELRPQARRLENAAGRVVERYQACFSTHDWTALAELLADDIVADDRRRVVNAGVRRGRDVYIADMRAAVEVGAETTSASVVATRGERLALAHARAFNRGSPPGEVGAEWLGIAEIDADERIVAIVVFDLDDIDAAFAELDARYLAGEAAAYAHTWSVIARTYAALSDANFHRRRRTGSTSTTDESHRPHRVT
jgi:ketosteroid isomerase-like protein